MQSLAQEMSTAENVPCAKVAMARTLFEKFHYFATAGLALGLVPAFRSAHLPLRFAWSIFFVTFWWALAFQSMVAAIVLYAVGFPSEFWRRLTSGVGAKENPREVLVALLIPATYFFVVLFLVISYNDVVAALRFNGSADVMLNRIDPWILGGWTVPSLGHRLSPAVARIMGGIYFLMFPQIGGCLILLALRCGRDTSMRFIATIATTYYIGLIVFYFVPATGPYYLSAMSGDKHFINAFVQILNSMRDGRPIQVIGVEYFVALPSLHMALPLVAIWYMRKWKPIVIFISVYCLAMIPALLLLQEHYVVDLIGGVAVAVFAVAITSAGKRAQSFGIAGVRV